MSTARDEIWEILNRLAVSSEDTDRKIKEMGTRLSASSEATDRKIKEVTTAIGRLGNRLGEFVEEMVRPAVVRLFQNRGIAVHQVFQRVYAERDGDAMEIDLLVVNSADAILIEVKSELKVDDIKEHISRLSRFKKLCPQYAGFRVMGAVAGMVVPDDAARFAYRQGLFVLAQSGESVTLRNDANFQPGVW
ncbi:MAG: DUF3782 domain-containing protein [Candidatus Methylumidiphilus sp.]